MKLQWLLKLLKQAMLKNFSKLPIPSDLPNI